MALLKLSTARSRVVFMVDDTDHVTGKTGLTLTITASKDGAAFASITPTVTELANGWYKLALTTSHTDTLGDFALHITGTDADPTDLVDDVVADLPGGSVSSVVGAVGSIGAGGITAASFAANALTAAKFATDVALAFADALLNRDMSAVSDTNSRSPLNALRFLRNKWSIATATLTVTKENDTTSAWTATVATTAGNPVSSVDPA
jgi:hypothetical protein